MIKGRKGARTTSKKRGGRKGERETGARQMLWRKSVHENNRTTHRNYGPATRIRFLMKTGALVDLVQHADDNAGLEAYMCFNAQGRRPLRASALTLQAKTEVPEAGKTKELYVS